MYILSEVNGLRLLDDVDFLDVVAANFGFLILGGLLVSHFLGYPENPITKSLQEWFFAILGFIIGKKGFLPKGVTGCVGCMNYRITAKEKDVVQSEKEEAPSRVEDTPSRGEDTPSRGEDTPSRGEDTPSRGEDTPSGNGDRMQS
jgi:hypothetical protein